MESTYTRPFRVLAVDGGGMRGLYTAILIKTLSERFPALKHPLDIGKAFDLITGTSTGGIIACGLALGIPIDKLVALYRDVGPKVFGDPMPESKFLLATWIIRNIAKASGSIDPLKFSLDKLFKEATLESLYKERHIALCIPAVNVYTQQSWVFKTPHNPAKQRDNKHKVADVCLATSAAPIFLPLAAIDDPSDPSHHGVFIDGGLWANNPVLIGMIEALTLSKVGQPIEILSVGTCAPPGGQPVAKGNVGWGIGQWRFGAKILATAMDAQSFGYRYMAEMLSQHLDRSCKVIRLPQLPPSPDQVAHLALDKATSTALQVLAALGKADADQAYRLVESGTQDGLCISGIFTDMPTLTGSIH